MPWSSLNSYYIATFPVFMKMPVPLLLIYGSLNAEVLLASEHVDDEDHQHSPWQTAGLLRRERCMSSCFHAYLNVLYVLLKVSWFIWSKSGKGFLTGGHAMQCYTTAGSVTEREEKLVSRPERWNSSRLLPQFASVRHRFKHTHTFSKEQRKLEYFCEVDSEK